MTNTENKARRTRKVKNNGNNGPGRSPELKVVMLQARKSPNVIDALQNLLKQAEDGDLTGIFYGATFTPQYRRKARHGYVLGFAGRVNPTLGRGMLMKLNDLFGREDA